MKEMRKKIKKWEKQGGKGIHRAQSYNAKYGEKVFSSKVIGFGKTQSPFVLELKLTIYSDCYRHLLVADRVDTFALAFFASKNPVNWNFKMVLNL